MRACGSIRCTRDCGAGGMRLAWHDGRMPNGGRRLAGCGVAGCARRGGPPGAWGLIRNGSGRAAAPLRQRPVRQRSGNPRGGAAMNARKATVNTEPRAWRGTHLPAIVVGLWRGRYLRFAGQQFVLLAAPARSGKGVGIVIPNLLSYPDSVVVLDIKRENYADHGRLQCAHTGRRCTCSTRSRKTAARIGTTRCRRSPTACSAWATSSRSATPCIRRVATMTSGRTRRATCFSASYCCCANGGMRSGPVKKGESIPDYPVTMGEVLRQSSGNGMPVKAYLQRALVQHRRHC
jgi:hypothetical protein